MARIRFEVCSTTPGGAEHFTVCTTNATFVDESVRLLTTGERRIPSFDLVDGGGCDGQWTWHVDPVTPVFYDVTVAFCDGCPSFIEVDKAYWIGTVKRFCPVSARVEAVSR
jgi:hypothetical protein